jgi:hypothetical protein
MVGRFILLPRQIQRVWPASPLEFHIHELVSFEQGAPLTILIARHNQLLGPESNGQYLEITGIVGARRKMSTSRLSKLLGTFRTEAELRGGQADI